MRNFVFAFMVAAALTPAQGQARPSASEAQALLQARPELVTQLRQRIMTSGMTAEQVRSRLRAEGYPENLLDAYLPGSTATPGAVGDDVFSAIRRLGLAEESDVALLRTMLGQQDSVARSPLDDSSPEARERQSHELFGLSLFRNATSEFLPTLDGPVDESYRLGPGDQLVLILTGQVELAHTLEVTREGFIVIPQVGQLNVANLTLGQLEDLLYARLPRSYSGVRRGADAPTRFSVSVSRLRAIQVYVTGDVVRPSSYRISSAGTAMTALYAAGGPTEAGTMRSVAIRRGDRVVATLDVYDYLLRGESSADIRLQNGDVVFVPTHGPRVRVTGEVTRPATYEITEDETLRDVLLAAGGFRATASTGRVQVQRIMGAAERAAGRDRSVLDVTISGGTAAAAPALPVEAGDVVRVFSISDRVRDRIMVLGHVWMPGAQQARAGMTLGDALRAAGGLKSDAYLGQVIVTRLRPDSTREQLRAVARDTTGAIVNDFPLMEDDEIQVFSMSEFRPDRYVAIGGSVRRSGRYPWHEGMTLRSLVLLAGGLREGAYLREAEIARLPRQRERGVTAVTTRVPMDSSYLGDYRPGMPYGGAPGQSAAGFGTMPEVELQPYDNVLIMEQPDWQLQRTVWLTGEVRFPGRYALTSKDERISDLISRAGGLTSEADPTAAYFSRAREATSFAGDSLPDSLRTRVGVSLAEALRRRNGDEDLVLIHRDSLHVPFRITTVTIQGQVNAPRAVTVDDGRSLGYYLNAAGGATAAGDANKAYVIQPSGKVETRRKVLWLFRNDPNPRPGATVIVPAKAPDEGRTERRLATVSIIAQTIASLAAVVAIMR